MVVACVAVLLLGAELAGDTWWWRLVVPAWLAAVVGAVVVGWPIATAMPLAQ